MLDGGSGGVVLTPFSAVRDDDVRVGIEIERISILAFLLLVLLLLSPFS